MIRASSPQLDSEDPDTIIHGLSDIEDEALFAKGLAKIIHHSKPLKAEREQWDEIAHYALSHGRRVEGLFSTKGVVDDGFAQPLDTDDGATGRLSLRNIGEGTVHGTPEEVVEQLRESLLKHGRLDYDGRPIFGLPAPEIVELAMEASKDCFVFPAHIFTPWFSMMGSNSGFDSMKECYQDQLKNVHAIETGLSSDPAMNWRLSQLDDKAIISFSMSPFPASTD